MSLGRCLFLAGLLCTALSTSWASDRFIIVQSTTSTENSGLYEAILPAFTNKFGIEVRVVAVGTGQALKNAQNCDGDVVLVHARAAEEAFVANGYGVERFDVMVNDFVIVGPASDSADLAGAEDAGAALARVAESGEKFVSRADDSGTHKKELTLWHLAAVDPVVASGDWYIETGSGMGATLNLGVGLNAYALTDRATWVAFGNKGSHKILFEGDAAMLNQYGVIQVSPDHCPNARADDGKVFVDWLLSAEGQAAIADYTLKGQQLFFPNARSD